MELILSSWGTVRTEGSPQPEVVDEKESSNLVREHRDVDEKNSDAIHCGTKGMSQR